MADGRVSGEVLVVSFSGIDGAGKSTQIDALKVRLVMRGLRVKVIPFWDEVAQLTRLRESAGHTLFGGDRGVGSPAKPIDRRDKNVRSWPMALVRPALYMADALSARRVFHRALRSEADVVIFDRWIYDELANLGLGSRMNRIYARLVAGLVPRPDASFLLDADPTQARLRKPEYPVEFLVSNRASYHELTRLIGGITVVAPASVEEVARVISDRVAQLEGPTLKELHAHNAAT
jgi:thymidylate kinase